MGLADAVGTSEEQGASASRAVCLEAALQALSLPGPAPSTHLVPYLPLCLAPAGGPRGQAGPLPFSTGSLAHWALSLHPKFKCQVYTDDTKMAMCRLLRLTHAELKLGTPREPPIISPQMLLFTLVPVFWLTQAPRHHS